MEELSNFTYLVLAAAALFRLCVFRSVSVRFIMFFQRKVCVNFSKSELIVLLSYKPYAFESALTALIE